MITALARDFTFFLRLHTIASGSCPFAGFISLRSSMALIVLRLTETGRIDIVIFQTTQNRVSAQRIGLKLITVAPCVQAGPVRDLSVSAEYSWIC